VHITGEVILKKENKGMCDLCGRSNHRTQLFQHILPLEEIDLDEFVELIIIMWENLEFNKHIEFAMA